LRKSLDKEYAPISGVADFCKSSINLALGDNHPAVAEGKVCTLLVKNWNFMNKVFD